jgi:carboxypeptidase Taq
LSVTAAAPPLERLKGILAELADLRHAESILDWDSRVSMPHAGARARADVSATLAQLAHERFVSDEVGELLEELDPLEEAGSDSVAGALIRVTRRAWERSRRVPTELAGAMSHANGVAVAAWDEAKAASDFASFMPHVERQLELKQRYIECFPETETAYDVLLEDYEEGMNTAEVVEVFDRLKPELVRLLERAREHPVDDGPLRGPFPLPGQEEVGRRVLNAFGFDEESWRIDETPHPFASKVGLGDIRLTTHSDVNDLTSSLFSTMHEFGHGVYEFDIDPAFARTPLGRGTSSAVHESQSRTWENLVGRSRGFWRWFYPQVQEIFPEALRAVGESSFVDAVNAVRPGPIRGDADEVSYGLHIILRFELEQDLLAGTVAVRDLPEVWNTRMKEYLGVYVPDDAHGVLQDMHWSIGLFGYFPTYQLGNILSVQIWDRARADIGDLEEQFARGEFAPLREWLREHIYHHGGRYPPRDLLRQVTGSDLDPEPYLEYLRTKFA